MKRSLLILFSVILGVSSLSAAGTAAENQRLAEGQITKNEAQHLVLKKYPKATIKDCVFAGWKPNGAWVITLTKAGSTETTKVSLDGKTGKFLQ